MIIEDGGGKGFSAQVSSGLRLLTDAVVEPEDKFICKEGGAFTCTIQVTPVGANDFIFYFKNTGTVDVAFTDVRAFSASACTLRLYQATGTPSYTASTAITPVNRNFGSSRTLSATVNQDTDITGLTTSELYFLRLDTANEQQHLRTTSNIIIPQGQAMAMSTSGTGQVDATFSFSELIV